MVKKREIESSNSVRQIHKKLFKFGGSSALVVPSEFTKRLGSDEAEVVIEIIINGSESILVVRPKNTSDKLDSIENDPRFALFLEALYEDALNNPKKLKDKDEVWSSEMKKLLKDVPLDDED